MIKLVSENEVFSILNLNGLCFGNLGYLMVENPFLDKAKSLWKYSLWSSSVSESVWRTWVAVPIPYQRFSRLVETTEKKRFRETLLKGV